MPRGQRKPLPSEEAEETRRTILRTAQELFMKQGYRAVSTRQIADACGLTQPALYHYFADKQNLYVAVMKEDMAETQAALERIARRQESVKERLQRVVRYLLGKTQQDMNMMMHDIRQELDAQAQVVLSQLFQNGIIAPIASIFEEGIQQGFLRGEQAGGLNATTASYLFMSMLSRFIAKPTHHPNLARQDNNEQAEGIVHILLYGLVADEKGHEPQ